MKTTFRRRFSSDKSGKRRLGLVLFSLVLGILIITILRGPIVSFVAVLWQGENALARGLDNFAGFFRDKSSLVEENQLLRDRLTYYATLETGYRALQSTQEEILDLFGRGGEGEFVAASVLAHPPQTPYDVLLIDVGESHGVEIGDRVSLPTGGALGRVSEVFDNEARVLLYSASGEATPAFLERGSVAVTLEGQGGGAFKLELPRDVSIEVGDRVLLPDLTSELVAVVVEVRLEATDSAKQVLLRSVGNVRNIRFVEVR